LIFIRVPEYDALAGWRKVAKASGFRLMFWYFAVQSTFQRKRSGLRDFLTGCALGAAGKDVSQLLFFAPKTKQQPFSLPGRVGALEGL
jgi:hypothetical protein